MIYGIYDKDNTLEDILSFDTVEQLEEYKRYHPEYIVTEIPEEELFIDESDDEDYEDYSEDIEYEL